MKRQDIRRTIEEFLRSYPYLAEGISAVMGAAILAGAGIGVGLAFFDFLAAVVLGIAGALCGMVLGWFLVSVGLAAFLVVLAMIWPEKWWIPVASLGMAVLGTTIGIWQNELTPWETFISLATYYVVSTVTIHLVLSIWQTLVR